MSEVLKTETGEQLNFIDLFRNKNYIIEIPIIQRDYAQGRENKFKIRNKFLEDIYFRLENNKNIDLDFVYGSVIETIDKMGKFIPLDGQQRLTTLFLLHWYLAHKDGRIDELNRYLLSDEKSRFTYETRTSSREFCDALINSNIDFEDFLIEDGDKFNSLSKTIKNNPWYFLSWDNDPTIKGMLVMLDAIHYKFKNSDSFFERLINIENPIITFQFLNLKEMKMTDDLYIKINARGKTLTEYENFKAQFEKFLEVNHPEIQLDFSKNIDGIWCDLFWNFSVNNPIKTSHSIDQSFLRFINFISEMLFYKDNLDDTKEFDFTDFKTIEEIFLSKVNIHFLINSLSIFSNFPLNNHKDQIDIFFKEIYSNAFLENRVALFDDEINLFEKLVYKENSLEHKDKLILFALFHYLIETKSKELFVTENLKNYIRICRNIVLKINQKGNNSKKAEFVTDLRTSSYHDIINTFFSICDTSDIYQTIGKIDDLVKFRKNIEGELFKANILKNNKSFTLNIHKLEDHNYLKGDLHNFENLISNKDDLDNLTSSFYQIWGNLPDDLIIRSLLSIGDYSIHIGNCYFGGLYFLGKNEKWNRILTDRENTDRLSIIFQSYFNKLKTLKENTIEEKIEKLVSDGIKNEVHPEWIKLFLKYPRITKTKFSIFTFRDGEELKIDRIDGTTLNGQHINSFIHTVLSSNQIPKKVIDSNGFVKDTNESYILLKGKIEMVSFENYWQIDAKKVDISSLVKSFKLEELDRPNFYKLSSTTKRDYVEIAIDFINSI